MEKLVSVLLPSRKRPDWLRDTLLSLHTNTSVPDSIEYLVKLDTDDHETASALHTLPTDLDIKYLIYKRGNGYRDIHHYANDLCKLSTGKWLFIMNDDARMQTKGWDDVIRNINPLKYNPTWQGSMEVSIINPGSSLCDYSPIFPMMSRKGYELIGHYSMHHHIDAYIQNVFSGINTNIDCWDIRIHHLNNDISDSTRADSAHNQDMSLFHKEENTKIMDEAKAKLLRHLGRSS